MSQNSSLRTSSHTTGLEELLQSRGADSQNMATLRDAREVLVGEASSSVPNASAYEIMCAVNHVREATGRVRTFIFPTAPIGKVVGGTKHQPSISQKINGHPMLTLVPDGHKKGELPFGHDPQERIANIVTRSLEKNIAKEGSENLREQAANLGVEGDNLPQSLGRAVLEDPRVEKLLPPESLQRLQNYLLKLPASLFQTSEGVPYVEHVVRQRLRYVLELGDLLLDGGDREKLGNFSVESIEPYLGDITLADIRRRLDATYDNKIALSFDCPECGIDTPESIVHSITFDGQPSLRYGSNKSPKKNPLRGCKVLKEKADTHLTMEKINETPVRELIRGGFTLSGTGIYATLSMIFGDKGATTLGVANYNPARGTVKTISRMWRGPMYITTRARIYREGRIATYPELQEWLRAAPQAEEKLRAFVRSIPVIATGPELRLDID